jgi:hypothetical protein
VSARSTKRATAIAIALGSLALLATLPALQPVASARSLPVLPASAAETALKAQGLISGLDFEEARSLLAAADASDPHVLLERARLALYELDCDGAAAILARREVTALPEADEIADVVRGCQRTTAAVVVDRDEARAIEVLWQDEHDRPLGPLLMDTVVKARDALTRDLGVDWPKPTRIVVVRDLLALSAKTGLPYDSARTTGTVAVAKWGHVTLLSPRASHHGYDWRDTLAHELTHLALTRASGDRAPLWLQEGVAKREQVLWRAPGPFDERPPNDAVVQEGLKQHLAIPLDHLGPSIAMLPSADAATVAFAEVASFIHYFIDTSGPDALPRVLAALKKGESTNDALKEVSGADLPVWDLKWRAYVAAQRPASSQELLGLGADVPHGAPLRELRERGRLAELLGGRQHPSEALMELDAVTKHAGRAGDAGLPAAVAEDPSFLWLRARLLEDAGRREEAQTEGLVGDPAHVEAPFGPWWATRGRWALLRHDDPQAIDSFESAVAVDPLGAEAACGTLEAAGPPAPPPFADPALCAAARAYPDAPYDGQ